MGQVTRFGTPLVDPVTADAVEEALAESWRRVRSSRDAALPVARASVLSLIVCAVDPATTDRVLEAISHLSRQHPSRTIILLPDRHAGDVDVRVWHATGCDSPEEQDRVVCGEQIVVAAHGSAIDYLPSLTDQLMLADLPAFLWWVGDLSAAYQQLFDRLTGLADRLVVDSSDFAAPGRSMALVDQLARRRHQPCAPSDLNWARLTPWRELVAQFFDSPALRSYLFGLEEIAIEHSSVGGSGPAQTALLVSWLATRLGWQLVTPPSIESSGLAMGSLRRTDGQRVTVTARSKSVAGIDGLIRVSLRAGKVASFLVSRENDPTQALTEADVAGAPVLRRIAHFEAGELSTHLGNELILFQRDHAYESALELAVKLAGATT